MAAVDSDCGVPCPLLACLHVSLGQQVFESVQLLCELSYSQLQPLVLVLQLQSPLLGQHDPPPRLVPTLPNRDVVPLAPQTVLGTVLADAALGHRGSQRGVEERGKVLLRTMALQMRAGPCDGAGGVTVRQVGQSHHLLSDPPLLRPEALGVRQQVHVRLSGRRGVTLALE